ncbi:hypothetical protein CR513_31860, partial [Mucuna pruriens]
MDVLYKINLNVTLLHCVGTKEAEGILEVIHEGAFGTHANGHAMAKKFQRADHYWAKMEIDYCDHVKKCHKCQIYTDNVHVPLAPLNTLTTPWPFTIWGIDVIDPSELKASNGHRFVLLAIDYFTKWVEAASYASTTKNVVVNFIKKYLIYQYNIPSHIMGLI